MKTTVKCLVSLLAAASIAGLTACSHQDMRDARVDRAVSELNSANTSSSSNAITDADNGGILHVINDGEIMLAQLAVTNASSQAVRDYAQMMITDHQNTNAKLEAAGYRAVKNPVTDVLRSDTDKTANMLRGKSGADFDMAYIKSQVDMHQTALGTIKNTLMPSAQSRDLRAMLPQVRDTVQLHLQRAREIQGSMH